MFLTRSEIGEQVGRLTDRIEKNRESNPERAARLTEERDLLQYAVDHATDEELEHCQLALPGRVSVMTWSEKHNKATEGGK